MKEALRLEHVTKQYPGFRLEDVSFTLPGGSIMGLIGENGAGKSTTIKSILGLIHKDGGSVELLGREFCGDDRELKEELGVVMDTANFSQDLTAANVNQVMKRVYRNWDEATFYQYLKKFQLSEKKRISEYSRGMRMKLPLAVALSHGAKVLILDEATSGLDPISRDELLDVFLEFIQDEDHSILMSSHILSDLEKVCDYITFIHDGRVLFSENKDVLLESYGMFRGSKEALAQLDSRAIVGVREHHFGVDALVLKKHLPKELAVDPADIETIMLYHVKHAVPSRGRF